jgi:hypothetical protein
VVSGFSRTVVIDRSAKAFDRMGGQFREERRGVIHWPRVAATSRGRVELLRNRFKVVREKPRARSAVSTRVSGETSS